MEEAHGKEAAAWPGSGLGLDGAQLLCRGDREDPVWCAAAAVAWVACSARSKRGRRRWLGLLTEKRGRPGRALGCKGKEKGCRAVVGCVGSAGCGKEKRKGTAVLLGLGEVIRFRFRLRS